MSFVDAHAHLTDPRIEPSTREQLISELRARRYLAIGGGGLDYADARAQIELRKALPCFYPVVGLHPYRCAELSREKIESELSMLRELSATHRSEIFGWGETGLDLREQYARTAETRANQLHAFETQIRIAQDLKLPLVLHVVRAHAEALALFQEPGHANREPRGIVHAFNASAEIAREWIRRGFILSIGGPLLRPTAGKLEATLRDTIPLSALLLESDTPDQPPAGQERSSPWIIEDLMRRVCTLKGISESTLQTTLATNFARVFRTQI